MQQILYVKDEIENVLSVYKQIYVMFSGGRDSLLTSSPL